MEDMIIMDHMSAAPATSITVTVVGRNDQYVGCGAGAAPAAAVDSTRCEHGVVAVGATCPIRGSGSAELKLFGVKLMTCSRTDDLDHGVNEGILRSEPQAQCYRSSGMISSMMMMPAAAAAQSSMRKSFSMGNLAIHGSTHAATSNRWPSYDQIRAGIGGGADSIGNHSAGVGAASLPSFNNLAAAAGTSACINNNNIEPEPEHDAGGDIGSSGYVSDGLVHASNRLRERKKGVPWSEDEHRLFLVGLQKLGKGDWRGISKNFVTSRTPTQVASHAQKYFLRQSNLNKRKRRSSLFDIISNTSHTTESHEVPNNDHSPYDLEIINAPMPMDVHMNKPIISTSSQLAETDLCLRLQIQDPHIPEKQKQTIFSFPHIDDHDTIMSDIRHIPVTEEFNILSPIPNSSISLTSTASSASASPRSMYSSLPLCRIDEAVELSNLSLSIGPPPNSASLVQETPSSSELSLKLELQPATAPPQASKHTALYHTPSTSAAAALAAVASSSTSNTTSYPNAISVV